VLWKQNVMQTRRRDLVQRSSVFSGRLLRFTAIERKRGVIPHSLLQQALRAGTAIGAHAAEADSAMTRRHLIALRAGALREAREVVYWLGLIDQSRLCAPDSDISWLLGEANELVAILSASIRRLRELP
jgi:four helix bundle protein